MDDSLVYEWFRSALLAGVSGVHFVFQALNPLKQLLLSASERKHRDWSRSDVLLRFCDDGQRLVEGSETEADIDAPFDTQLRRVVSKRRPVGGVVEFYRQLGIGSVLRVDRLCTLIPDAEEPLCPIVTCRSACTLVNA